MHNAVLMPAIYEICSTRYNM